MLATKRPARPSRQRSPLIASMITTGSVRGKCSTLQAGHSRFQPACVMRVGAPQLAQKRCRACQASSAFASASGARCIRADQSLHGDRAQVGDDEIGAPLQSPWWPRDRARCRSGRFRAARPRNTVSAAGASARASSARNSGSGPFAVRRITTSSPPIANVPARPRRPRRRRGTSRRCAARRRAPECWRYSRAAASARDQGVATFETPAGGSDNSHARAA